MADANREEDEDDDDEVVEKAVLLAMEDAEGIAAADDGMGSGLEEEDLCRSSSEDLCGRNSADPDGDADDGVIGGSLWIEIKCVYQ